MGGQERHGQDGAMRWAAALGNTISLSGSGPAEDAGHKERGQDRARLVMYLGGLMPCCMPALYSMLCHAAAQYCLYCSHQCAPRRSPSSPVPGHTTAVCPIDQVSAVAHSMYIDSPTTCPLLYVPTAILVLESWPGSGDACGQALCRSLAIAPTPPLQSLVLVPVPVMVLVPPGPWPPPPAPALAALQVAPAEPIYRVHALCSSRNSILARFLTLNQTFVSLSLPLVSAPSLPPFALWCMHLHHVRSLSTNWHLLGSDRDTKTKLGTNPSRPNYLVQTTWSWDRHFERTTRSPTPARPAPSFSLCFGSAHLVFPWPPPSLFLFDCNARNCQTFTHPFSAHCLHTSPCPLDARCDVQPHPHPFDQYAGPTQRAALTTDWISPPSSHSS